MHTNTGIHEFLRRRLPTQASILEIGGGAGTEKLLSMFDKVTVIEHDSEYMWAFPDAQYIHAPLLPYDNQYFREATLWYDHTRLNDLPEYDAIIVDGPKGSQGRGGFLTNIHLFNTRHYVFDDVHRMWDFRLAGKVAQYFGVTMEVYPQDGNRWFAVVRVSYEQRQRAALAKTSVNRKF